MTGALVHAAAVALALAPANTGAARAPVRLTAAPARVMLAGGSRASVRVSNFGTKRVLVDVSRAGFALDLRGRPEIVRNGGARSARAWLTFRPAHFVLGPQASAALVVSSTLPRHAEPGDHDALVLLTTHAVGAARVAVRLRMGVVVVIRAPGKVVRLVDLRGARVTGARRRRRLELVVANRGNVTESLRHPRAVLSFRRSGRWAATLASNSRDLRPQTSGLVEFRLPAKLHGVMTARIVVPGDAGRSALRRTYRLRL